MNLNIFGNTASAKGDQPLKYGLSLEEQSKLSLFLIVICSCLPAAVLFTYFVAIVVSTLLVDGMLFCFLHFA